MVGHRLHHRACDRGDQQDICHAGEPLVVDRTTRINQLDDHRHSGRDV